MMRPPSTSSLGSSTSNLATPTDALRDGAHLNETWKPVVGRPEYEVSDQGRVRSLDRIVRECSGKERRLRGRVRKLQVGVRGYLVVGLGHVGTHYVHLLVLTTFVGPRPEGQEGRHLNGVRTDARLSNLAWGTLSENGHDRVTHGHDHHAVRERCPRKHPLEAPNLVPSELRRAGTRRCLACSRAQNWTRHHQRPDLLKPVSDAYYAQITGDGGAALRALGVGLTSARSLVATGGDSK